MPENKTHLFIHVRNNFIVTAYSSSGKVQHTFQIESEKEKFVSVTRMYILDVCSKIV